jgi:hypothetical protein
VRTVRYNFCSLVSAAGDYCLAPTIGNARRRMLTYFLRLYRFKLKETLKIKRLQHFKKIRIQGGNWDSVVGRATGYGLDNRGGGMEFESR